MGEDWLRETYRSLIRCLCEITFHSPQAGDGPSPNTQILRTSNPTEIIHLGMRVPCRSIMSSTCFKVECRIEQPTEPNLGLPDASEQGEQVSGREVRFDSCIGRIFCELGVHEHRKYKMDVSRWNSLGLAVKVVLPAPRLIT